MDNIVLVFNETTQKWEERKEPFITVEIETEEDYEFLKTAVEYYGNRDKHVEVVHGRWLPYHKADIGYDEYGIRCSNCRLEFENHEVKFPINYCPNCGAKMDGGKNASD